MAILLVQQAWCRRFATNSCYARGSARGLAHYFSDRLLGDVVLTDNQPEFRINIVVARIGTASKLSGWALSVVAKQFLSNALLLAPSASNPSIEGVFLAGGHDLYVCEPSS